MKISHLVEYIVDEAGFSDMDQKAKNIQKGKGAATDSELRQQRIAQLAANQKARNAAPAGRPMAAQAAPADQKAPAAPAQRTAPAAQTATPAAQPAAGQTAPAAQAQTAPADQKAPAAEPTGIIDKFKQGWAKARAGTPATDKSTAQSGGAAVSGSAELKQIAQIQQEIQLDIADLKKQVAVLSAAASSAAQPAPAESSINNGKNLSEQLAQKVQQHKNKLFKEQFIKGQTGLFVR